MHSYSRTRGGSSATTFSTALVAPVHNHDLSVALKMKEQIAPGIVKIHVATIAAWWKPAYIDYCRRLPKAQIGR